MERGARREVGVEGRLSVVNQRGQEDDKGVTKQRTMVFESLGVGMLLWPGAPEKNRARMDLMCNALK